MVGGGDDASRQEQDHEREQPAEYQETSIAAAELVVARLVEPLDDERAEHRPPERGPPAEQQREDDLHAQQDVEHPERVYEADVVAVDAARHSDEDGARHEREDLVRRGGHADRRRLVLVLADRDQAHAELVAPDPPREQERQCEQAHQRVVEGPVLVFHAPGWDRQRDAARAVRELIPVRREQLDEEEERDCEDHERMPASAHRHDAEQGGHSACEHAGDRNPDPRGAADVVDADADRVRAEPDERTLPERDVAGVAGDDVQPHRPDGEDHREDDHVLVVEVVGQDRVHRHEHDRRGDHRGPGRAERPGRCRRRGRAPALERSLGDRCRAGVRHAVATSWRSRVPRSPCGLSSSTMNTNTYGTPVAHSGPM